MKKVKSNRGVFEAIVRDLFSYAFYPETYTTVDEAHIPLLKKLYGDVLHFEDMTPEQVFDASGTVTADPEAPQEPITTE